MNGKAPERPSVTRQSTASGSSNDNRAILEQLTVVDYRYARYALNTRTGLWFMVKYVISNTETLAPFLIRIRFVEIGVIHPGLA
jgi:hypothetical protein